MLVDTNDATLEAGTPVDPGVIGFGPGVVGLVSGDDVEVSRAGVGVILARHDVSLSDGASCFPVFAGSTVRFERGASCGAIAGREVTIGRQGVLGIALAPKVTVEEGGRVLMTATQAAAFGAAIGAALLLLFRSRKDR